MNFTSQILCCKNYMKKVVDIQTAETEPFCRQGKTWLNQKAKNWRWKTSPAEFSRRPVPVGDVGETSEGLIPKMLYNHEHVTYWFYIHI